LSQGAAPGTQDVPVKFAFTAPNVPDNAAFDALALKIASHSSDGDSRFSIRLDPPELGKIEVNLSVDAHGHAQAELSADKPQTLDMLQKDASSLERALKDAGLNLTGGLAFSLKGEGRSQGWRDAQGGRNRNLTIAAADAVSANAALTARGALAAQAYGLPTSQLDIRV
jgi:flagellar hook-length control protein FliK